MLKTVLLLLFGVLLFWLVGCSATIKTGQLDVALQSKPPGIASYTSTTPGLDLTFMFDPWFGIEKAAEGLGALVGLVGDLFGGVIGLPVPVDAATGGGP